MARRVADVAVHAPDGSLQLEVEAKTRRGASPEWAARLLRNIVFHEAGPSAPYFMLALPDRVFLWDLRDLTSRLAARPELGPEPDYEADAMPVFGSYLDGDFVSAQPVGEDTLALVVASWLTDLLNSAPEGADLGPDMRALLFKSGLYDAAKRGAVATEAALW